MKIFQCKMKIVDLSQSISSQERHFECDCQCGFKLPVSAMMTVLWMIAVLQGVPENLTHFVLYLLHFKILFIIHVKQFVFKLTQNGEKRVSIVL